MSIRDDQHVYVTQTEKLERLQRSHDRLLAVSKESIALADRHLTMLLPGGVLPHRTDEAQELYNRVVAAIAAAEELEK